MSNQQTKRKRKAHQHRWVIEDRKLVSDFTYYYSICEICHLVRYPAIELQKLYDYSVKNLFFFVEDWVIVLLYAGNHYIAGITHYQKMLFLIFKEFAPKYGIPSENLGFFGYKYGPYSARIDATINYMVQNKFIHKKGRKSTKKEIFTLTEKGTERAIEKYKKLNKEQKQELKKFRKYWDQKKTKSLISYVYNKYPKYTKESLILNDVFPDWKLHRKRG